jgi:hypothetical protein
MTSLRLAFVTEYDATDPRSYSGVPSHMVPALERAGASIEYVGPLETPSLPPLGRLRERLAQRRGQRYQRERNPGVLRAYAREVARRLDELDVDAILSPGTIPIALLDTPLPIAFWADATFFQMVDYNPEFTGLSDASIREGNAQEGAALARASLAAYCSEWAASSAIHDYGTDPAKVMLLAFGANLTADPDDGWLAASISARPRDECRLAFLGVDWIQKGGDRTLAIAERLTAGGLPTRITVIGPPSATVTESPLIEYAGFIDKRTPEGLAEFSRLLARSHFMCLPTRTDCCPISICEASAYALPTISTRIGGVGSVVLEGRNGLLFDEPFSTDSAADAIASHMAAYDERYLPLARSSANEYRTRLNWDTSAGLLVDRLSQIVAERRR